MSLNTTSTYEDADGNQWTLEVRDHGDGDIDHFLTPPAGARRLVTRTRRWV